MSEPMLRRSTDQVEGAYFLAILYTVGYLAMMAALMTIEIPTANREILLTLVGIMSAAQLGIIKYYYDGSKGAERAQVANIQRATRSEGVLQEIAKSVPVAAAVAAATVTPAANLTEPIKADSVIVDTTNTTVNNQPPKGTS